MNKSKHKHNIAQNKGNIHHTAHKNMVSMKHMLQEADITCNR